LQLPLKGKVLKLQLKISRFHLIIFAISLTGASFARETLSLQFSNAPWLTGPLLSASPHVTPTGEINFEPIYSSIDSYAYYDSNWKKVKQPDYWVHNLDLYCNIGINPQMDFLLDPGVQYNCSQGSQKFEISDMVVALNFQLLIDRPDNYLPSLKLGVREQFPNGKYDQLNPSMHETEVAGQGSYMTCIYLCAGRMFNFGVHHWLSLRLTTAYTIPSRIHVKGHNLYGGAKDTDAYVYPGQFFDFDIAWEFTLAKKWALACDNFFRYTRSRTFKGNPGTLDTGRLGDLSGDNSIFFGFAPAIEYNWSANGGIIAGAEFTVAGRNSAAFAGFAVGVNLVF
jgi:hypothetical protein